MTIESNEMIFAAAGLGVLMAYVALVIFAVKLVIFNETLSKGTKLGLVTAIIFIPLVASIGIILFNNVLLSKKQIAG